MRSRKEHVITAVKGDAQPWRLVALACEVECLGVPGESAEQRERLVSWSGAGWERGKDGAYREWCCHHADPARLWRAFEWGAKRSGVTWLVAHRAVRVASLLGLWEMIDDGRMQWDAQRRTAARTPGHAGDVRPLRGGDGPDDRPGGSRAADGLPDVPHRVRPGRSPHDHEARVAPPGPSSVALDDPPTILRLRLPNRPGRLWLMDSRNWGIDPPPDLKSAADESRWLAGVMRRMVTELNARGWGGLKATAGSQSLYTWRRKYLTHEVTAHADPDILALEERAYVGGRCECGRLGAVQGPLYMVDRRSAYAHACATVDVPLRVIGVGELNGEDLYHDPGRAGRCLAEVGVTGSEPAYPVARRDGVRYPVGHRSLVLAGPELRDAVERGAVRRVGRVVEYQCGPALREYALALHGARCEFDLRAAASPGPDGCVADGRGSSRDHSEYAALATWAKKLLVGLPGKLGQRVADWSSYDLIKPPAPWYAWWGVGQDRVVFRLRSLGGAVQKQQRGGWTYDSAPAAACWILSAARLELLRAIRVAGWSECVYWDTDSLLLTQAGWDRVTASPGLVGQGLGQWRLVRQCAGAVISGVKYYSLDGDVTCAGLPKADTAASRLADRYWYRQTFGVALAEGHAPQAARRLRAYVRAPSYNLGRVGDGGRVYPFVATDF